MRSFRRSLRIGLVSPLIAPLVSLASLAGCGSDTLTQVNYGSPPEAATYDAGLGGGGGGGYPYGYGGGPTGSGDGGKTKPDATVDAISDAPVGPGCPVAMQVCPQVFTYPYGGEISVSVMGNYSSTGYTIGTPMVHSGTGPFGSEWYAEIPVPYGQPVDYAFQINGNPPWATDPNNPKTVDAGDAGTTSQIPAQMCTAPTCAQPGALASGIFDWRDAVLYFVFVDRFNKGTSTEKGCSVSGASTGQNAATSANYLGGNWAGVTDKINDNYFNDLGVNTLWITVPVKNADALLGAGVGTNCSGTTCQPTSYEYTSYHGYWPADPDSIETCFGSQVELQALITAAHKKNLKVLFDYAMVDIHTSSALYQAHVNDSPSWFTEACQCGAPGCSDYNDFKCWFAPYLAHYDFTNSTAARESSVTSALNLVKNYGNDAFRLDAIKQVDPSWLASLRPGLTTYETQLADGGVTQHFYMVGETYDFNDMAYIASFVDPEKKLDGQFDFPLRYRLVDAMLLRDTSPGLDYPIPDGNMWTFNQPAGMTGLAKFLDFDDSYYPTGSVMSTFVGNQDLPRSIHFGEQTLPSWLGSNDGAALTTNGSGNAWTNEPGPETDPTAFERLANAFAVLFTTKGAPLIYYGDEVGLAGAGDPDNRRFMQWTGYSAGQTTLHDRLAKLLHIRANHPALRRGIRTTINVGLDTWVFSATTTAVSAVDTVYVAFNRSDAPVTVTGVPGGIPELVTGSGLSTGSDIIPARQVRIWSSYVPPVVSDAGTDASK